MSTKLRLVLCIAAMSMLSKSTRAFLLISPATPRFRQYGKTNVSTRRNSIPHLHTRTLQNDETAINVDVTNDPRISIQQYQHKDGRFNLTYLYKKAAPGRENDKPIVFVHPVGIGISSWFWTKILVAFEDNPPLYAPDLIGCGLNHGGDAWNPDKNGLFFPLSWVEGIETLIENVIIPRQQQEQKSDWSNMLFSGDKSRRTGKCLVIAQGGLAPVGVMLARRNLDTVGSLILTSPPSYNEMITAIPERELERNFNFLRSQIFGNLAFAILESKEIIRFFSDLFLFQDKCDNQWLDETRRESSIEARPPVCAFNAGLLQHRSFEEELRDLPQNVLIVSGLGDKRVMDRKLYESEMNDCTLKTIDGLNVMPWENPDGVIELIQELGY